MGRRREFQSGRGRCATRPLTAYTQDAAQALLSAGITRQEGRRPVSRCFWSRGAPRPGCPGPPAVTESPSSPWLCSVSQVTSDAARPLRPPVALLRQHVAPEDPLIASARGRPPPTGFSAGPARRTSSWPRRCRRAGHSGSPERTETDLGNTQHRLHNEVVNIVPAEGLQTSFWLGRAGGLPVRSRRAGLGVHRRRAGCVGLGFSCCSRGSSEPCAGCLAKF